MNRIARRPCDTAPPGTRKTYRSPKPEQPYVPCWPTCGHHPDDRPSQDAQLVVTELVANALRHAPGPGDLALEVTPDAALLHITVRDSSPRPLELRAHDARRVGGHGLYLVTRLCDQLHTIALETGKQIVAQLRLRPPVGQSMPA